MPGIITSIFASSPRTTPDGVVWKNIKFSEEANADETTINAHKKVIIVLMPDPFIKNYRIQSKLIIQMFLSYKEKYGK